MNGIIFRNKKTGRLYHLIMTAIDCTNSRDGTSVVVYRPADNHLEIFVRDEGEFQDKFEVVE